MRGEIRRKFLNSCRTETIFSLSRGAFCLAVLSKYCKLCDTSLKRQNLN
jgi:hypothetical protein